MSGDHIHSQTVPKAALWGAGFLIVVSMGLAAGSRHMHIAEAKAATAQAPAREAIDIRVDDRPDGTLAILDASTRGEISLVPPKTNGFVRGVLRGMFRNRKLEAMSRDAVFHLSREANGRMILEDRETGRRVDLDSFGPTNAAAFNEFLAAAKRQGIAQTP